MARSAVSQSPKEEIVWETVLTLWDLRRCLRQDNDMSARCAAIVGPYSRAASFMYSVGTSLECLKPGNAHWLLWQDVHPAERSRRTRYMGVLGLAWHIDTHDTWRITFRALIAHVILQSIGRRRSNAATIEPTLCGGSHSKVWTSSACGNRSSHDSIRPLSS